MDSHLAYLEVKHKVGLNRTVKSRIPVTGPAEDLTGDAAGFLAGACPYRPEQLRPKLWNYATRITLVSKPRPERVTLDVDLAFSRADALLMLPGIVVAEVKYQGRRGGSEFMELMHRYGSMGFLDGDAARPVMLALSVTAIANGSALIRRRGSKRAGAPG